MMEIRSWTNTCLRLCPRFRSHFAFAPQPRVHARSLHSEPAMMRRVTADLLWSLGNAGLGTRSGCMVLTQHSTPMSAIGAGAGAQENSCYRGAASQHRRMHGTGKQLGSGGIIIKPSHWLQSPPQPFACQAPAGHTRGLFIQTQSTPNPQSLMFLPGKTLLESGSKMFPNARAAMISPLASKLFTIDGVTAVLFGSDFITVTKQDDAVSWATLKPDVFAMISDHLSSGEPLILDEASLAACNNAIHPDDSEVVAMIKELLETRIRPAVQEDGGDIKYKDFNPDTGVVTVTMMGSCSGCPSSTVTLKSGVENMLMHYVPEVTSVVLDDEDVPEEEDAVPSSEMNKKQAGSAMEQHLSP